MANIASITFLAITDDTFRHFAPVPHTHFKTKTLCLVSNKRWVKRLLLKG